MRINGTLLNISCLLFALLSFTAAAQNRMPHVGIIDFSAKGVTQTEAAAVCDLIRVEMVRSKSFFVLERGRMDAILKEQELQSTGCTEGECAVKIGKILNVGHLVYGSISKLGDVFYIQAQMVNVETSRVELAAMDKMYKLSDADIAARRIVAALSGISSAPVAAVEKSPNADLIAAAQKGDISGINAALADKADINTRDTLGNTALMWAAYNGHAKAVSHLIDKKADMNILDPNGWNALAGAVSQQKWEAARVLIERGANVNTKDKDKGNTPLMWAAYHGDLGVTKALVAKKANINEVDNAGWTALMGAIYKSRIDVALYLIGLAETDVAVKAKNGVDALALAEAGKYQGLIKVIGKRLGQPNDIKISEFKGERFTNSIGMVFHKIPEGTYKMGNQIDDAYHCVLRPNVTSFYLSQTEVTYEQWQKVYSWAILHGYSFDNRGDDNKYAYNGDKRCPVNNINWYDTVKWCNAASEIEKRTACYYNEGGRRSIYKSRHGKIIRDNESNGYRLPAEYEWEYACRANTETYYYWGDEIVDMYVWWGNNSSNKTHPVNYKMPNVWGLYDMSGNVWEWCEDIGRTRPASLLYDSDIDKGIKNIIRGGAANESNVVRLYSEYRSSFPSKSKNDFIGFRLAVSVK